jgi:DNA-binding LacI/PurR family transcriptional regulator
MGVPRPRTGGDRAVTRQVTMKEIAAAAGVSQSTISRVLNGRSAGVRISDATTRRIFEVAADLGYRPNPLARGLRGGGTALLGLIVREIADPFLSKVVQEVVAASRRRGYNVVLGHAASSAGEVLRLKTILETRHCDALVLLGDVHREDQLVRELEAAQLPVVGLCRGPRGALGTTVNVDNRLGTRLALNHLRRLGHRRIAFVADPWIGDIHERRAEFRAAMEALGEPLPDHYVCSASNDAEAGAEAVERLLRLAPAPTALFCATDVIALGALHGAAALGVAVPDDLSVVGFDDIGIAPYSVPALTTVQQPVRAMVQRALDLALGAVAGEGPTADPTSPVRPKLSVRGSCGPAASRPPAAT